jgi:hypothetical protein
MLGSTASYVDPPPPVQPLAAAKKELVPDPEFDLPQLQHEPRRPQAAFAAPVEVPYVPPMDERSRWIRYAVAAVVLVALTVGGMMAVRRRASASGMAVDTGTLTVNSNPAGAQLLVDGKLAGVTPTTLPLPQGTHSLTLRGTGAEPRTMDVAVSAGTQVSQYIELPRAEARGEATSGRLQVRTDPPGAIVTVDSIPRGASPVTIGNLAPGDHSVVVSANGNSVQRIAYDIEVVAPGSGDDQSLAFAVEQFDAELHFQRLDLMADRALRDT